MAAEEIGAIAVDYQQRIRVAELAADFYPFNNNDIGKPEYGLSTAEFAREFGIGLADATSIRKSYELGLVRLR